MQRFVSAIALAMAAMTAAAQTEVAVLSEAQRLACLSKPADPPRYPQHHSLDREEGAMRLLLKFSRPDGAPEIQVLYNTAREDMQDRILGYVGRYRLPCLQAADGVVAAVQDFSFRNHDRNAPALPVASLGGEQAPRCLVRPRHDLDYVVRSSAVPVEHLLAEITFSGDGTQSPEVTFKYAKATPRWKRAVLQWASGYRMPCRTAQDKPETIEQQFSMFPAGKRRLGFTQERFSLTDFLGMTREPHKRKAYFDLRTMGCPFSASITLRGDGVPNKVEVPGPTDPNKVALLGWLADLQLDISSAAQATDLFGSKLQIDVPCGVLDLRGEESPAGR